MEENKIILALEIINNTAKNSELNLDLFDNVSKELELICNYFQVSRTQAIILAISFIKSCFDIFDTSEIIAHLGIKKHRFLKYLEDFNLLSQKSILTKTNDKFGCEDYKLSQHILNYILSNQPIPQELLATKVKDFSFNEFLAEMDSIRNEKKGKEITYIYFLRKFIDLLDEYKQFKLVEFAAKNLQLVDSFVFFDTILDALNIGSNDFSTSLKGTVDDFYERNRDIFNYMNNFLEGKTALTKLNLIEKDSNSFANRHKIKLTQKAVLMLKDWEGISIDFVENKDTRLIYPEQIQRRNIFYNEAEELQLKSIKKSLSHTALTQLQNHLRSKNMTTGFTALLYGAAGSGKTETVYQLAKKFKRPIFKVEISETKSMWFGESQKLVKKIFTDYNALKKAHKITPILFFNEADAIIGKRKNAGSSSVSETENAIQNVLLEELENFDGILFATSNLVANLDIAFERRFLFKVKFENPCQANAAKIWKSKLPTLSNKEAFQLASKFSYSGGEMENIARKSLIEEIIEGSKPNFEKILFFCENEKWNGKISGDKIGY